jgi:Spy/CpxP family protein refolding chaperone
MPYTSRYGFAVLFLSLVTTRAIVAQQPQNPPPTLRPLALLTTEAMQKELELTAEQQAKIAPLHKEYMEVVAKYRTKNVEEIERIAEERTRALQKINDKLEPQVKEILTAKQFERALQVVNQYLRLRIFHIPGVIKALELTDDQRQKIEAVASEYSKKEFRVVHDTESGPKQSAAVAKLRDEAFAEVEKVLTKDQNEKWLALRGKPFDISKLRLPNQSKADEKKTE